MGQWFETGSARYEEIAPLGSGGQGDSFLVRRASDGQRFALKQLRLESTRTWKALELFDREAQVLQALDHPGIPTYVDHESDAERGSFVLVQQYVEGETLDVFLGPSRPLQRELLTRYLRDCLEVLQYLGTFGPPVVHRDLKPQNIIVDGQRAYVIDFGSVRVALGDKTSNTSTGTFGYMAPEQLVGKASQASDMYALGMTFSALFARRSPNDFPLHPQTGQIDTTQLLVGSDPLQSLLMQMTRPGLGARLGDPARALAILDGRDAPPVSARPRAVASQSPSSQPALTRAQQLSGEDAAAPGLSEDAMRKVAVGAASGMMATGVVVVMIVAVAMVVILAIAGFIIYTVSARTGDVISSVSSYDGPEPTSVEAPSAFAGEGELTVTTEPAGALVRLQNKPLGLTPLTVKVSKKMHRLTIAKRGYQGVSTHVNVTGSRDVHRVLKPHSGGESWRHTELRVELQVREPLPGGISAQLARESLSMRSLRSCYHLARKEAPKLEGEVTLAVVVGADGVVSEREVSGEQEALRGCAERASKGLRFPERSAGVGSLRYVLRFAGEEDSSAP